jgi:tetratricopeptide (TPR) repeat protein
MKQVLLYLSILLLSLDAMAGENTMAKQWKKANDCYQQKQYDSAIFYYQILLQQQASNASIYYNLGNAYYRKNQVADAVVQYERALFFKPQYKEAQENNLLAKSRIPNALKPIKDIFFVRWWHALTASHWANTWAIVTLLLLLTLASLILYGIVQKSFRYVAPQVFVLLPIAMFITLFLAYTAADHKTHCDLAVVNSPNATLNLSKSQSRVPEATTVKVTKQEGNGFWVTLPDNRSGWMRQSDLTFVHISTKK